MLSNKSNPSSSQHRFSRVPRVNVGRSMFRRNHTVKTSFDADYLVPIYVDEVLPGDTFQLRLSSVARVNTPAVPFMDNLYMDFFFFYCPNRILWNNWEKFMGAQVDPGDSIDYTVPQIDIPGGGWVLNSLADYFGLPVGDYTDASADPNALHFRAYNLIWNEWFRDQNIQDSKTVDLDDGPDSEADYKLLKRNKKHDYFTSCLPWPQKGTEIDLPLGTSAPILASGDLAPVTTNQYVDWSNTADTNYHFQGGTGTQAVHGSGTWSNSNPLKFGSVTGLKIQETDIESTLTANLTEATAATINELREAFQLQRMMERDARSGTRYCEVLMSHFGVMDPSHAVLQRPEYLGGGSTPIQITPIPQTSESGTTDQGHLAAVGYHAQSGVGFNKSFTEHGVIIGLANVRADLTYQRGINRMWSRQTREEFYFPALAHLGEQAVLRKELYTDNVEANNNYVFGYQERWAEYRFKPNIVTGKMHSYGGASLDVWHLAQEFDSIPSLNSDFITSAVPLDRVVSVPDEDHIIFDGYFDVKCIRPMPLYSQPGLIDHF